MPADSKDTNATPHADAPRGFGRFDLLRLIGKSDRTMAWRVADPRSDREWMLVLPRIQPAGAEAMLRWQQVVRRASRLDHPQLAAVVESGVQDGWPYVAYDLHASTPLSERLPASGLSGAKAAGLTIQLLQALAYAHEGGVAHQDLQPHLVLVSESGQLRLAGTAVAVDEAAPESPESPEAPAAASEAAELRALRAAAERDVLAAGLLLHLLIGGSAALATLDIGRTIARLPPLGRDIVRLPWTTAQPIAAALRAIVNRATDRQERHRYRNARTLLRALEGWRRTEAGTGDGPLALLTDRLRNAGVLPSLPDAAARAARLALMERERTNELADVVLEDPALAFELLRLVNSAQVRGVQVSGSGPVLTLRRAIAMVGLEGVRRSALGLRAWPGPLDAAGAAELQRLFERCKHAARSAVQLRPAGYDAEVVYVLTLLQNLGRLVVQYHYPDEARQIRRLMQAAPASRAGEPEEPGMSEEGASFAVLGAATEAIGVAVARFWGLDESVLAMICRQPLNTALRAAEDDNDLLRAVANCANEAVEATLLPVASQVSAVQRVAQRYGRVLGIGVRDVQVALGRVAPGLPPAKALPLEAGLS